MHWLPCLAATIIPVVVNKDEKKQETKKTKKTKEKEKEKRKEKKGNNAE